MKYRIFDHKNLKFEYFELDNVPNRDIFNLGESQQFTGIVDKNGKEIYEGDILAEEHDLDKDCIYDDVDTYMDYHVAKKAPGYFYHDEDDKHSLIRNTCDVVNSWVEVVGNIYENPELIKH